MTLRIIGGQFKGRILKSPKSTTTRPTQGVVREAVFNICQDLIREARFLDLFAGSGAMGLEALSRGASHATFVERDKNAASCIKENLTLLNLVSKSQVISIDAEAALKKMTSPFDIIYIDPPYDTTIMPYIDSILENRLLSSLLFLEERQKTHTSIERSELELYDKRRYGIALLSIFRYTPKT
ncbi:MAG: 16S rRNA (guanine(966)-N(2))-methyltransferase RsmD [Verrucomicrobia bacterium]|nr:16S rRNA (guanine(966)-N(2))-methyltransferase RsmD [Verrucomicrobiota bacterium]